MKLCVGACSRLIIEEAAKLRVAQIVASRRQVDIGGGYTGLDQYGLVELVRDLSGNMTEVVRDHGGPRQGGADDDGVASLEQDVDAGFDALHLDVCELPRAEQHEALAALIKRFDDREKPDGYRVMLEVGDEHAEQDWNDQLWLTAFDVGGATLRTVVVSCGTHVWADGQIGTPRDVMSVSATVALYRAAGYQTKAHNMDWVPNRAVWAATGLSYYNLAPELGAVEIDAITDAMEAVYGRPAVDDLLEYAYASGRWERWYGPTTMTSSDKGVTYEPLDHAARMNRARTALRYLRDEPYVIEAVGDAATAAPVREAVRRAIVNG